MRTSIVAVLSVAVLVAAGCGDSGRYMLPVRQMVFGRPDVRVTGTVIETRALAASEIPVIEQSSVTGRDTLLCVRIDAIVSGSIARDTIEVRYGAYSLGKGDAPIANPPIAKGERVAVAMKGGLATVNRLGGEAEGLKWLLQIAHADRGELAMYYPQATIKTAMPITTLAEADEALAGCANRSNQIPKTEWSGTRQHKDMFYRASLPHPFAIIFCFEGGSEVRYFCPK